MMHAAVASRLATTRLPSFALQQRRRQKLQTARAEPFKLCLGSEGEQDRHQRLELSSWAGSDKENWSKLVSSVTQDLKCQDADVQAAAAVQLGQVTMNPFALSQLHSEFAAHGTMSALADALKSSSWDVKILALSNLNFVACEDELIAAHIPVTVYPSLVEILQEAPQISNDMWRMHVQAGAAGLARDLACLQSPGAAAVDIVPLLVDLLDIRNKGNTVCISAAFALMFLGDGDPVLLEAVKESGALQKLYPWLVSGQSDLMMAALKAIGTLAKRILPDEEGRKI